VNASQHSPFLIKTIAYLKQYIEVMRLLRALPRGAVWLRTSH